MMIDVMEEKKTKKRNRIFWGVLLAAFLLYAGYILVQVYDVNVYIRVQQYADDEPEIVEEKNPFTKYWFLKASEAIDAAGDYVNEGLFKYGGPRYWSFGIQKGDDAPIYCYWTNGIIEKKVISGITTTTTYVGRKDISLKLQKQIIEMTGYYK